MKSNVKAIRKCPAFTKEVISFDKKGNRVVKMVEVTDKYLVVLNNGSSVAMTKEQMKYYGIVGTLPDTNTAIIPSNAQKLDVIEEDLDETDDEVEEVVEEPTQPTTENVSKSAFVIK